MKERYRKFLSEKLEEYLHSDVAIPMQEAYPEALLPHNHNITYEDPYFIK
jgi:hypothetical protein